MGNWLKGRVFINDVTLTQPNNQAPNSSPNYQVSFCNIPSYNPSTISKSILIKTISIISINYNQVGNVQSMSHQSLPIYYPAPPYSTSTLLVSQLAEEEQIQIAKRIGLIQHLPIGTYDGGGESKNSRECVICMVEFSKGDSIRFLPCLHTYHVHCIDDWLMRSFICPSCMEPVDIALLSAY